MSNLAPKMVPLPIGRYLIGASQSDKFATDTERPRREVHLSTPCALSRNPVSVAEFRRFAPGHDSTADSSWPVSGVSWNEAAAYCCWLAERTGRPYRLPAETEWEIACRAGTESPFSTGQILSLADANYLYSEEGQAIGLGRRTPVGVYPANGFGFHDLHGNVCEWVADPWHSTYHGAPSDASSWEDHNHASARVIRGGAWDYLPRLLRSSWRDYLSPSIRRDNVGFRLALTLAA